MVLILKFEIKFFHNLLFPLQMQVRGLQTTNPIDSASDVWCGICKPKQHMNHTMTLMYGTDSFFACYPFGNEGEIFFGLISAQHDPTRQMLDLQQSKNLLLSKGTLENFL